MEQSVGTEGGDKYAAFGSTSVSPNDVQDGMTMGTTFPTETTARLLDACISELKNGVAVGKTVHDPSVVAEVKGSEQGRVYLDGLQRIYLIGTRILFASSSSEVSRLTPEFESVTVQLHAAFASFGLQFETPRYSQEAKAAGGVACGVCGLSVDDAAVSAPTVEFRGKQFYVDAANLWISKVTGILPVN
jgi:hypothetical protein